MVTLVATGKVQSGGAVQITATTLPARADHPVTPVSVSEWEKGRRAYFTALIDEGMAYEPAIEDDYSWIRTGC